MHILVTGGAGYIGTYVTYALLARGHEVTVVDDLSNGYADEVPRQARLVIADVTDIPPMTVDAIVHLASRIVVADPGRSHWVNNVGSTLRLLERVRADRVVFASSAAVYGNRTMDYSNLSAEKSIPELSVLRPLGAYGQTKVAIEQMLAAFGGQWTALRLFNVAGGCERHKNETHLLPLALRGKVTIHGSEKMIRDYVHVEDVADAFVRALDAPAGIYNIGTGVGTSVIELIDCVVRVTKRPVTISYGPYRAGDVYSLVADIEQARELLGWAPKRNLEDIVRSALVDIA